MAKKAGPTIAASSRMTAMGSGIRERPPASQA